MPRQFHKITSKEYPNKQINLEAMSYEQALEEALDKLGWVMQSEWNEPYNSMFQDVSPATCCEIYQDDHIMSLWNKK
jgi:predicted secreted protein